MSHSLKDIALLCAGLFLISLWSGVVAYIIHLRDSHEKPSLLLLLSQVIVSCFTGFLGGLIAMDHRLSFPLTFCVSGLSGTLGIALLRALQKKLLQTIRRFSQSDA
ncbi:hypothetical protein P349_04927 [Enterobacter sp. DC4]|uniref:phage holin family protein n=1 Tax=Enterobacter sp. DC4 TaxID=1395580 RepID=UPI0003ECEE9B|nr:phage holin family protein [Enterobacter sp. DC4]EWG65500.1 hypothetical protein P349_04927 [Enterobacter sp. DC4]